MLFICGRYYLKARLFGGRHKAFTSFLSFISDHDNQFRFLLCQYDSQLCTLLFSLYIYLPTYLLYKCYSEIRFSTIRLMSSEFRQPIWLSLSLNVEYLFPFRYCFSTGQNKFLIQEILWPIRLFFCLEQFKKSEQIFNIQTLS